MEYDNTNRGALFKNERREKETHSDYNGTIDVNGEEFWINAWVKESKSGKKFFSLSVQPKDAKPTTAPAPSADVDFDDDLPF